MPSQQQQKSHKLRDKIIQRYISLKIPLSVKIPLKVISNMTVEILRIYEDHVTATFTLINVREWLAASGGTKFSKPIEEMSKEEFCSLFTIS